MADVLNYLMKKNSTQTAEAVTQNKNVLSYLVPGGIKEKKNNGSPLTYFAANLGLGVAGVFEGAADIADSLAAKRRGDDMYAEYVHKKNIVGEWKRSLDKKYNPGKAMTFVGDVGQGIGQSSVMLLDAVAPGVGTGLFFAGVAGNSVSDAVQTTGELGAREYIYGIAAGGMEAALEKLVGAGGQAAAKIAGKAGGSITAKISSKVATDAVWKGVVKEMISEGAGEFVEEFLSEYGDVALRRMTGVDKDAETTLGQAVYAGLVGFASGALMGGGASAINIGTSYKRGSKIAEAGNADTLVKTAQYVADNIKSENEAKLPEAVRMLKKTIRDYNAIKDKNSNIAKVKLGEMQAYMTMVEVSQGVYDAEKKIMSASAEALEGYAKVMSGISGKTYTAADIKANKDNITTRLATMSWAGAFLSDTKAERDIKQFNQTIESDRAAKAAGQPATVPDIFTATSWDGGDATYSAGDDYIKITELEDGKYSIAYGKDAENIRGFASKSKDDVKELLSRASAAARAAMETSGAVQDIGAVTTHVQGQNATATATTAPTEAQTATGDTAVADALAQVRADMNTGSLAQNKYTAAEQDAARRAVKDFDMLPADTRVRVLEWVRSAKGVDKDIVSAVSFIMSVRPGLQVIYAQAGEGHKELYTKLKDIDRRLIVTSGDASAVRETLIYELVHDMRDSAGWNALRDAAMNAASEEEKARITELYREVIGGNDAVIEEDIVAKTVGKLLVRKPFLQRYAETGKLKQVINAAKSLFEYIKSKGPDRITLMETARIMRLMDSIIAADYVKGQIESVIESGAVVKYNNESVSFAEQIDAVLSGKDTTSTHIRVADTQQILKDIGAPDYISDPIMIMDSLTRDDSVVIVTELRDNDGKPVIAAILLNGSGAVEYKYIPANIERFIKNNADAGTILYWNKKKSQELAVNLGFQLPNILSNLDSDIIIRKPKAFVNMENKKIEAAPPLGSQKVSLNRVSTASDSIISQKTDAVNKDYAQNSDNDTKTKYNLDETEKTLKQKISELTKKLKKSQEQADYWRRQTKRTVDPSVDEKAVAAKAKELRKRYNSRAKDTEALLKDLYDTMAQQLDRGTLNGAELYEKALTIAQGIVSEAYELSPEYETFRGIRAYVYSNKLKVGDAIKGDFTEWGAWMKQNIPYAVDNKNGTPVETAYAELAEIFGEEYFPSSIEKPADQLRHIAEMMSQSKDKMQPALFEDMETEARLLANTILDGFMEMPYAKPTFADKQAQKYETVKAAARLSADADRAKNTITKRRTKGVLGNDEYNAVLVAAKKIKPRYEINPANAREFAKAYYDFLAEHASPVIAAAENKIDPAVYEASREDNQILQYIDPDTVRGLKLVMEGDGALNAREMNSLHAALSSLLAMEGRVDRIYLKDRWVDVAPRQTKIMEYLHDNYGGRITSSQAREITKLLNSAAMYALDPEDVTRLVEGVLTDGELSKMIHELKLAEEKANYTYDQYTAATEAYMRDNKDFFKSYHNDAVKFTYTRRDADGNIMLQQEMNLTKGEAMQLYMTVKREQAKLALAMGRVKFENSKRPGAEWKARIVEAVGEQWWAGMTEDEFESNARRMVSDMEKSIKKMSEQFTEQDKEFIKLMEDYYNRMSREDKMRIDDILWGKTNVLQSYYVPISRSEMARELNLIEPRSQEMSVRSLSFNKDTVKGANAQLVIGDAYEIMKRHAKQMSRYVHMTIPLMNFQRLYNHRSDTAVDKTYTIREYIKTYGWEGYEKYIIDYFQDAQGLRKAKEDGVNRASRIVKSATAKYYIGANLGSMAKQMSSVLMMSSIVSREAWVRGIKPINTDKIDRYSVAAANRNSESAMYYAQGVQGTLGKVGNVFMTPIKWGDRAAVQIMWSMCQHEVALKEGLALGTEENLKRAGEMLDDAILAVQDTGSATTKTGIARHPQELVSALAMFRSAPAKMFSRLYVSVAEIAEIAKRKKQGKAVPEAAEKRAVKKFAVLGSAIMTVALYESIIGLIRNSLRGKDDEEEVLKTLAGETALNIVGLVPVAGQIAENWLSGYDVSLFHLDFINDTKSAINGVTSVSDKMISGEYVDDETIRRNARNVVYAFGRLTGIPTKNLHNIFMSALSVDKTTKFKNDALFTDTGMTKTLQEAIEKGDDRLSQTVISTLYNKRTGAYNSAVSNKIAELYAKGYTNVLAVSLPTSYTGADGSEQKVTAKQYKAMEEIYSQTTNLLSQMITDSRFLSMSEEAQAKAISVTYRAYHNKAKSEVLGVDKTQTVALMDIVDPLALIIEGAYISTLPGENRAAQAKERIKKYDEKTQAAILYACGYKSASIKSAILKYVDSATAKALNLE